MQICWGKTSSSFKWTEQFLLNWLFLVLLSCHSIKCEQSEIGEAEYWEKSWRLSKAFRPHEYSLTLEPRIEKFNFLGKVTIYFTSTSPKKSVVLHSKGLSITNVALYSTGPINLIEFDPYLRSNRKQVDVSEWFLYEKHEFLVVKLKEGLEPGLEYVLEIHYQGSFLKSRFTGFYTSSYKYLKDKKTIAATQFEPNDARKAFPCFDEPHLKAAFDIEIIKPSRNTAVFSNMPVLREVYDSNKKRYLVQFERSPVMSTYTLCWVISDFQVVEELTTSSGVLVRGLARRGHEGLLGYATNIAKKSIEFHEDYTGVGYLLDKIDIAGIPDFVSGAMENWGLVLFREIYAITYDHKIAYKDYFNVANTVCHEVAHMWFGNLVTMKWWDHLWLNEGFATFFSMKCTKAADPEFKTDELSYIFEKLPAFETDSVVHIHPIVNNVTHNNQLNGVFDDITYKKGHCLLEMLEDLIGYEAFQQGISLYLNGFALRNTDTQDLCNVLGEVSGLDICSLMEDWTTQPGHPVITVEKQDNRLYLTQTRFIAKHKQNDTDATSCQWAIPVKFITADCPNKMQSLRFSKEQEKAVIELKSSSSWFKLNPGQIGFYRVNYSPHTWKAFAQHLINFDPVVRHWADRANLLDDACNLAGAGHIKYSVILDLFAYLGKGKETHYAPWVVASKCLNDIKGKLSPNVSAIFSEHVRHLIEPELKPTLATINKKKSSPYDFDLQNEVIFSLACAFKHPEALEKARHLFKVWLSDSSALNPDIKAAVFKHGVSGGKDEESTWKRLWSLYIKQDDPFELKYLRIGLTSINRTDLHEKLVELSGNEDLVRNQDYYSILSLLGKKSSTSHIVWGLFTKKFYYLEEKFRNGRVSDLFQTVACNFDTLERLEEVKKFVEEHPSVVLHKDDFNRCVESILDNIKEDKEYDKDVEEWLNNSKEPKDQLPSSE